VGSVLSNVPFGGEAFATEERRATSIGGRLLIQCLDFDRRYEPGRRSSPGGQAVSSGRREAVMRQAIDELVGRFERGALSRRELIAGLLAVASSAADAAGGSAAAPPIEVSGIDHLALRVQDVERSARFYADHLGARIRSRSPSAVFMDVGAQWIALFGPGAASTGFPAPPPGLDHVSFRSASVRGFEERTQALRERGLNPQSPPGSGRVYFKDPDGVTLQLS
jgi:catechol 2,3-dioxygenase-like lactoylglutathione lyase family enzyme